MRLIKYPLKLFLWPGNWFCAAVGQDTREDNGMLRGFINNIFWGVLIVTTMALSI
ncbi:MAG: hypothetical protein WD969_02750 [Paracoccaceae bacterium]